MVKFYTRGLLFAALFVMLQMFVPSSAQAQIAYAENFDYPEGDLLGNGSPAWMSAKSTYTNAPVQVVSTEFDYAGYAYTLPTKAAKLVSLNQNQHVQQVFSEDGITEGTFYYSALVKVTQLPETPQYILSVGCNTKSTQVQDGKVGSYRANLFMGKGSDDNHYKLGVAVSTSGANYSATEVELGKTCLVVVKVALGDNGQDVATLYVDPVSYTTEPEEASAQASIAANTAYTYKSVILSQQMSYGKAGGETYVSSIHASDSYAGLFSQSDNGGSGNTTPSMRANGNQWAATFDGCTYSYSMVVKGSNLTGDITLACTDSHVALSRTTVTAAEAMSSEGATVEVTLKPTTSQNVEEASASITMTTDGAEAVSVPLSWAVYQTVKVAELSEFLTKDPDAYEYYLFTGEAYVTFVDKGATSPVYYLQDSKGGITLCDTWESGSIGVKAGDVIKDFVVCVESSFGNMGIFPPSTQPIAPVREYDFVIPEGVSVAMLKANPASYLNRVVKLSGVTLSGFDEGAVFAEGMTQPVFTDADGDTGKVRVFKGTNLIGTAIPTEELEMAGILTSKVMTNGPIIAPRDINDFTVLTSPSIELSQKSFLQARGEVGTHALVGTVHVVAKALAKAVEIAPSSAMEGIYSTDITTIPAGSGEYDIKIYYDAPNCGKHNGMLYFCYGDDILEQIKIYGMATDPATPPTVTVDRTSLDEFVANIGETVTQTINVTGSGLPDYIQVKVTQSTSGFTCNSTSLYYAGTQKLVISFRPMAEGEVTGTITIGNEFVTPITINIKGRSVGTVVEPGKEGDELPLSDANPIALLDESFGSVGHNKAISLNGWKNVAMTGQRAWWGYVFPDYDTENYGNSAAKVTAFDSKADIDVDTDCQMLLVTPALDFVNAEAKLFTFRVMGNNLTEEMNDKLELCYIYLDGTEMAVEPITGLQMPCVADDNGKWMEYHVDLNGLNIEDVFFMGFRFTSKRGRNSTAIYYIDDVTYGRGDIPYITTPDQQFEIIADNQGKGDSETITVSTRNLTDPVKIKLAGEFAEYFSLSTEELPAEGGEFTVSIDAPTGDYYAYVQMSSTGASDKIIVVYSSVTSGISTITLSDFDTITVYDTLGRIVCQDKATSMQQVVAKLAKGAYIIKAQGNGTTKTFKIAK